MKKPNIQATEIILSGEFYSLRQDTIQLSDGKLSEYISLDLGSDAAVILAQDLEGRYILNREYRYPIGGYILGCPGGRIETDEDPLKGGARELVEETGYTPGSIELLGCSYPFPGLCSQKIYFLWAKNCEKKGKQQLDALELISTELKSEEELKKEIKAHHLIDGNLCTALWYKMLLS